MADKRIRRNGWSNITLVQSDAAAYGFSEHIDGIISTFALTLVPEYDKVIQRGAAALSPSCRFVIVDFKKSDNWPIWLLKLFVILTRPFGVSLDLADRHPWESVERYMALIDFKEIYFGGKKNRSIYFGGKEGIQFGGEKRGKYSAGKKGCSFGQGK